MTYTIHYYNSSVQAELFALPETLQGKYVRLSERMEIFGANLGAPHTKAFGDGLFELRLKGAVRYSTSLLLYFGRAKNCDVAQLYQKDSKNTTF